MSMNKNKVSFNALLAFAVLEADFQDQQLSPSLRKMAQIPVTDQFTAGINQLIKNIDEGKNYLFTVEDVDELLYVFRFFYLW